MRTVVMLGVLATAPALAQEPLTYNEALQASLAANVTLQSSEAALAQAEGALLSSRGGFDPLYTLEGMWTQSRSQGFFQGFPFDSESRRWDLGTSVGGTTGTGTTYSVGFGLERDIQDINSQFGGAEVNQLQDFYRGTVDVSVSQELLRGIRFSYNVQNVTAARQARDAAELAVEQQRQQTLYQAAQLYWAWAQQERLVQIARDALETAEEALRVGRLQVESGQLAPVEGTRLEAAMVQAQKDLLDAQTAAEQAENALLVQMGQPPGRDVIPATEAGDVPPALAIDPVKAAEVAEQQNLDLAIAEQNLETAKIELSNARHGLLPSLQATAATGLASQRCAPGTTDDCVTGNALDALTGVVADDRQPYVTLSGIFTMPLGNRAARGDKLSAEGLLWQREQELENARRTVRADVEEQVLTLQSARRRMELADVNVRLAEETLRAEEALAEAGRTILKDVLEARVDLNRALAEASLARTDYRLAQAELLRLQGLLTDTVP